VIGAEGDIGKVQFMMNDEEEEAVVSEDLTTNGSSSGDLDLEFDEFGSWVSWFCSMKGNEFFCEVDEDYMRDGFNLSGLSGMVPHYEYALDLLLDPSFSSSMGGSGMRLNDQVLTAAQEAELETAAEVLYGLIHARYVITAKGLATMLEKYKCCDFGRCPRVLCHGQPCLPVGTSDVPRQSTVKLFCPGCEDVYYPRSKYHGNIDGAYFGTTFPHLFMMTYPQLRPDRRREGYVPRVFGFRISPLAQAGRVQVQEGENQNGKKNKRELDTRSDKQQHQSSEIGDAKV